MRVFVGALVSAVLSTTCKESLRSQSATDRRKVSLYDSRLGSDIPCYSVAEVSSLQLILAVQVPGRYTLVLIDKS